MPSKAELELAIKILQDALKEAEPDEKPKKRGRKKKTPENVITTKPLILPSQDLVATVLSPGEEQPHIAPAKAPPKQEEVGVKNRLAQRQSLYTGPRPNTFFDDGRAFAEESVKKDPRLGGKGSRNVDIRDKYDKTMMTVICPECKQQRQEDSRFVNTVGLNGEMPMVRCLNCSRHR